MNPVHMPAQMKRARGFTLIELLIALAVFAVLAMLAYGGLNTVLNTRALTDQKADALRELQLAYRSVERDIDQWVPREIRDEFGTVRPALTAGSELGAALELTRGGWRNPAEQPRSTLQRVAYSVQDNALVRLTWLSLDRAPDAQPVEQTLLTGVSELRLRFLDAANVWQERWPPTDTPAAGAVPGAAPPTPRAVEWVLVTEHWGELRWLFRLPG
ncbi:MAG: type II secretion system minor pseudopilin GspJ [Gammaproteobacteria bacterium]|nr:type II secretion system minor pseudopilin GspJ [Gammaproteobacteria bacterium]